MLRKNFLKEKLESGQSVLGTFCTVPSVALCDVLASSEPDFIVIDCEHGPISFETAQGMVIACESQNVSPVVRVADLGAVDILKSLDIGAHAVQVPNITTAQNVRKVIEYYKYPPAGNRGFSPFTRAGEYSLDNAKKLTAQANRNVLTVVHIEGLSAIDHIEEILEIKELDIIFLGLFDISKSLGIPGEVEHPRVIKLLKDLTGKIDRASKIAGTIAMNARQMEEFLDWGLRYITYSVDCEVIRKTYRDIYAHRRKLNPVSS